MRAAGSRRGGALPAASALRVPGLRLRTDRSRDNGPRPQLGLAGPGLPGTGPRQAEGGCGPGRRRGGEGRRSGQTKPTADRRTEGEKDGDADDGSALFALSQRVGRVPEPHLSPPAAAPTPPDSRGARLALWAGPRGKGLGRRDLESNQSRAFQRGPARVLVLATRSRASRGFRRYPQRFRASLERVNSTRLSSPPWFPLPTSSSATKPTSPNHNPAAGFPISVAEPEPPVP